MKRKASEVGVAEAKSHLSELLEQVRGGGQIVTITRHGRPIARLVPAGRSERRGRLADIRGWLADDDPFFENIRHITRSRSRRRARAPRLAR